MITIDDVRYLIEMFDDEYKVKEPFIYKCSIDEGTPIYIKEFIHNITSLEGVVFTNNSSMEGLGSLISLDGVILGDGVTLSGLKVLKSLKGVSLGDNVTLNGLNSLESLRGMLLPSGTSLSGLYALKDISYLRTLNGVWIGTDYPGPSYIEGFQMGPGTRISNIGTDSIDGISISEGCSIGCSGIRSLPRDFPEGTEFGRAPNLVRISLTELKRVGLNTIDDIYENVEVIIDTDLGLTDAQKETIIGIPNDLCSPHEFYGTSIYGWINDVPMLGRWLGGLSINVQVKLLAKLKELC